MLRDNIKAANLGHQYYLINSDYKVVFWAGFETKEDAEQFLNEDFEELDRDYSFEQSSPKRNSKH